ncbi:MAG: zf-HC2 domain-containing protein [bacterium]|jgi:hypothetical protein
MKCSEIRRLVSAYSDDALEIDGMRMVSMHLKRCADCTRYFEEVRAIGAIASKSETSDRDIALENRIFAVIVEQARKKTMFERLAERFIPDWRYAAAGSIFLLAVSFGLISATPAGNVLRDYAGASAKYIGNEYRDSADFFSNAIAKGKEAISGLSRALLGEPRNNEESSDESSQAETSLVPATEGLA